MRNVLSVLFLIVFSSLPYTASAKVTVPLDFHYGFSQERIVYYVDTYRAREFFRLYANEIDVIAPQSYQVTGRGTVFGSVVPEIKSIAHARGVKIMPLVYNAGFSSDTIAALLDHPKEQSKVASALVLEALKQGYVGWQLDIEHIPAKYRDKYTTFVATVCTALHQSNLACSVAVVAQQSTNPDDYPPGSWNGWVGVYDYHGIAQSADFLSIMSYDDPSSTGPVAGIQWYQQVLDYTTKLVPANKISFGLPLYAWEWNADASKRVGVTTHPYVAELLRTRGYIARGRDEQQLVPWVSFKQDGQGRKVWYEDMASVRSKLDLIKEYNIRGFSAWMLGVEDEKIWTDLLDR